jgi:hypothetical protein
MRGRLGQEPKVPGVRAGFLFALHTGLYPAIIEKMIHIEDVQERCINEAIVLTEHLVARMRQRGIKYDDIKQTIQNGEVIEQYPTDYPFPSCLISSVDLHIVCSIGEGEGPVEPQTEGELMVPGPLYVITAYRPSEEKWEKDGKTRRRPQ